MRFKYSWLVAHDYFYPVVAPIIALVLLLLTLAVGLFDRLENLTADVRFKTREPFDPKPDPRVVLVKIDQTSLDNIGRMPWDRSIHGDFCQLAAAANVSVLGFDLLFTEPEREPKDADADFADAASQVHAVVTGADFDPKDAINKDQRVYNFGKTRPLTHIEGNSLEISGQNIALLPIPPLLKASYFGFVESPPTGADGVRRALPLLQRVGKDVFPGLSLQMLLQYWNITPDQVRIRLGSEIELSTPDGVKHIPINEKGEMLLNYRASDSLHAIDAGINAVSYGKLLGGLKDHFVDQKPLDKELPPIENGILLIGETAKGATDLGPSPLGPNSPLVAVHLTALNNILTSDYLKIAPDFPIVLGWLLVSWGTLLYLRRKSITYAVAFPILCILGYIVFAVIIFIKWSLLIPLVWPIVFFALLHFGIIVHRWLEEQKSRQQLKQVFSRMLSEEVMEHLLESSGNMGMGGAERPVTILFSDIRDYTKFSEGLKPTELVRQLNIYFERMVTCINDCEGTLHKYIGDAIMAAWGDIAAASHGPEKDAENAVKSALVMRRLLRELNAERKMEGLSPLRIGMGLNHGPDVLVGLIGAARRSEFTVMGDAVNIASRLEGLTKEYKTDLAIGETVHALVRDKFLMRTLGLIVVKGKTKPIRVYEVLDFLENPLDDWNPSWVAGYEKSMEAFFARDFRGAGSGFKKCLETRPEDFCSKEYLQNCEKFTTNPPPQDWDGRVVMTTK